MNKSYWLINSNRSEVKRFIRNNNNKDKFYDYIFIDSGKIIGTLGMQPPVMKRREEFKIEAARHEWKRLISNGWRRTKEVWGKHN